jgi:hypothetical protein
MFMAISPFSARGRVWAFDQISISARQRIIRTVGANRADRNAMAEDGREYILSRPPVRGQRQYLPRREDQALSLPQSTRFSTTSRRGNRGQCGTPLKYISQRDKQSKRARGREEGSTSTRPERHERKLLYAISITYVMHRSGGRHRRRPLLA